MGIPTLSEIQGAAERIKPFIQRTPVLTNSTINKICTGQVYFKCENFQKVGAFKARGALNAVLSLQAEELKKGVATHSSGNHAAALAYAAGIRKSNSYIVMPETAPIVKQRAVAGYGAKITFCKPTQQARESTLEQIVEQTGATFIHPYNDYRIIAGQGTAALELLEERDKLDFLLTPVGGGGLTSGSALSVKSISPSTKMIGTEPDLANDAFLSFTSGTLHRALPPKTIADGLLTSLGDKTFPIIQKYCDDIITVNEEEIIQAMRLIWERMKIIIEPSSAVPLAALLSGKIELRGKKAGIILSGGNVELDKLPW